MEAVDELKQMVREQNYARQAKPTTPGYAYLGKAGEGQSCSGWPLTSEPNPSSRCPTERLHLGNIEDTMTYQPWGPLETSAGEQVKEALTLAAKTILRVVPDGAFRSVALRNIIDARMNANAAISFHGRF